ncbi:MAG TPA: hypothetical protein VGK73_03550, partial [Polyangiaceae bacterium]
MSKVPSGARLAQRTLFPPQLPALRRTGALLAACLALACGKQSEPAAADAGAVPVSSVLPQRAEVVAEADALAVEAARRGGAPAVSSLVRAATLRERMYRLEHREADALEAVELWG